jgi:uncharacterized membrane protein
MLMNPNMTEEIEKIAELKESGALTEEEYQSAKALVMKKERLSHMKSLIGWGLFVGIVLGVVLGLVAAVGAAVGPYFKVAVGAVAAVGHYFYTKAQDAQKNGMLFMTVGNGDLKEVQKLIDAGADVNAVEPMGFTALMAAAAAGSLAPRTPCK